MNFASQQSSDLNDTAVGSAASSISLNMGTSSQKPVEQVNVNKISREIQQNLQQNRNGSTTNMRYMNRSNVMVKATDESRSDIPMTRYVPVIANDHASRGNTNMAFMMDRSDRVRRKVSNNNTQT